LMSGYIQGVCTDFRSETQDSCRRSKRSKNQPDSTEEAQEEKRAFIGLAINI